MLHSERRARRDRSLYLAFFITSHQFRSNHQKVLPFIQLSKSTTCGDTRGSTKDRATGERKRDREVGESEGRGEREIGNKGGIIERWRTRDELKKTDEREVWMMTGKKLAGATTAEVRRGAKKQQRSNDACRSRVKARQPAVHE